MRIATPEEALAHIEALRERMGWEFPADKAPEPRRREPKEPPKKEPPAKQYERCGLCETPLKADEREDGVCAECLRRYQTPPMVFGEF